MKWVLPALLTSPLAIALLIALLLELTAKG